MNIILFGPPGVGKGTQAKLLSEGLKVPHISSGDILRAEIRKETELGKKAKAFLESGELVPDEIVNQMIKNRLAQNDTKKGFVLDGFPRNSDQAIILDKIFTEDSIELDCAFYLDAAQEMILERLTGRRVCKKCGANYHIKNMPPKKDSICDLCTGELYQRPDDNEETIENRLNVYTQKTEPIINYYQKQEKLHKIDSNGSPSDVYKILMETIRDLSK